jgi:hypothetical protein
MCAYACLLWFVLTEKFQYASLHPLFEQICLSGAIVGLVDSPLYDAIANYAVDISPDRCLEPAVAHLAQEALFDQAGINYRSLPALKKKKKSTTQTNHSSEGALVMRWEGVPGFFFTMDNSLLYLRLFLEKRAESPEANGSLCQQALETLMWYLEAK